MAKCDLPPFLKGGTPLFKGKRIDLYVVNQRECVIHPGAVVILPLLSSSEVIMIRNERFVLNECLWELPAGTLESNEEPFATAARELIEETGYQAKEITPLFDFYTTPGFCNEKIYAFLATDLTFVGQALEETEKITTEILSWEKVLEMIQEGVIHDGKTIATLLYYRSFLL
jgi:ADP-ribose pyrophosphatase